MLHLPTHCHILDLCDTLKNIPKKAWILPYIIGILVAYSTYLTTCLYLYLSVLYINFMICLYLNSMLSNHITRDTVKLAM